MSVLEKKKIPKAFIIAIDDLFLVQGMKWVHTYSQNAIHIC